MQSPPFPHYLVPPRPKYSPQQHVLRHLQLPFLPRCQLPSFTPIQITSKIIVLYILIFKFLDSNTSKTVYRSHMLKFRGTTCKIITLYQPQLNLVTKFRLMKSYFATVSKFKCFMTELCGISAKPLSVLSAIQNFIRIHFDPLKYFMGLNAFSSPSKLKIQIFYLLHGAEPFLRN